MKRRSGPESHIARGGWSYVLFAPDGLVRTKSSHTPCKGCGVLLLKSQIRARRDGAQNWGYCHECR